MYIMQNTLYKKDLNVHKSILSYNIDYYLKTGDEKN